MGRKYGISTVCLVLHSFGKGGFKRSLDIAEKLGLDGIKALPMRGWPTDVENVELYKRSRERVISFSEIKNDYPFMDLYLFGFNPKPVLEAMENVFGREKFVDHKFSSGCVLEICPEASTQIQNYINYKNGLVWDTRHVRDNGMPDWRKLLLELPPENIKTIHFQPKDEKELAEFMNCKQNELSEMLGALALKASRDCPVILEIKPTIRTMTSFDHLMKKFSFIKGIVSDIMM